MRLYGKESTEREFFEFRKLRMLILEASFVLPTVVFLFDELYVSACTSKT